MNNIFSAQRNIAIFLATLLVLGTISTILPSAAQAQPYYEMDSSHDSYQPESKYPNNNSYEPPSYPLYKPDYDEKYPSDNNNNYKSKDSSKSVNINKIKCINDNININGVNAGNIKASNNSPATLAAHSFKNERHYDEEYDNNKQNKGFNCIVNNDSKNRQIISLTNETIPNPLPSPPPLPIDLDLAVLNQGFFSGQENNVSILLGNGDGTFGATNDFEVGSSVSTSLAVGDFNGDRISDLVIGDASPVPASVFVLLGNGDGTFGAATEYPIGGGNIVSVVVGDFNNDGDLDIATANQGTNNVSILLGNGDGTFGGATEYPVSNSIASMVVGDFNNDGDLDIVIGSFGLNSSILLGNGDGTFGTSTEFFTRASRVIAAGDFDGDDNLDLVGVIPSTVFTDVIVTLGNGDGMFDMPTFYPVGHPLMDVAVGDFNNDGDLDLVIIFNEGILDGVSILLGNGDGTFGAANDFPAGSNPSSIAVADFNNDGNLDLAITNRDDDNVSILLGNGEGVFSEPINFPVGDNPVDVVVGNFN